MRISFKIDSHASTSVVKTILVVLVLVLLPLLPCIAAGTGNARHARASKGVSAAEIVQATRLEASLETSSSEPMLTTLPLPVYQKLCRLEALKRYALRGTMVVRVFIDPAGKPVQIGIVQSLSPMLDEEVLMLLIQESRFKPAVMLGKPVASSLLMTIKFE